MTNTLLRLRRGVDLVFTSASALLLAVLVVAVTWQVLSRYVLGIPSTETDELSRFLLIWLVLIGAAPCVGGKKHLAIDFLEAALAERGKRMLSLYIDVVVMAFAFWVMVIGGWRMIDSVRMTGETSPALQLPMGAIYSVLPLSGIAIVLYCAIDVVLALAGVAPSNDTGNEMVD
ncbi:MAG: TRAP transporter small permease [Phyllobacteriaceae bacterium]|nr:TRAP transporter small permease [Phyllobacteriaceae bacterium]